MPLLIPFVLGAGATGYWWWNSKDEAEPTFSSELFETLKPILIVILVILFLRWLYVKGTASKTAK